MAENKNRPPALPDEMVHDLVRLVMSDWDTLIVQSDGRAMYYTSPDGFISISIMTKGFDKMDDAQCNIRFQEAIVRLATYLRESTVNPKRVTRL